MSHMEERFNKGYVREKIKAVGMIGDLGNRKKKGEKLGQESLKPPIILENINDFYSRFFDDGVFILIPKIITQKT